MKMVKILLFLLIGLLMLPIVFSCTFDNEEDFLKNQICDTTDLVYNDLTHIFDICATCHNSTSTYRVGIEMDKYESVKASINTGLVLPAIKHTGPYRMPDGLSKLSDCNISKIEAWINNGMPEN